MRHAKKVWTVAVVLTTPTLFYGCEPRTTVGVLTASGTVEATEADLGFELPGRIQSLSVGEGDVVTAGSVLAVLEQAELDAGVAASVARVGAAEARLRELRRGTRRQELAAAEAALQAARRRESDAFTEADRARRLFEGGALSRQALDRLETAAEVARSSRIQAEQALELAREGPSTETVEAQVAMVEQARANLARAEAALSKTVLKAPFDGRITLRHREPGETTAPGAPVLTLQNPNDRWVRIYVPAAQVGRLSIGQAAEVRADTYPDRRYAGVVVFIGSEAEFTPRNVQTPEERMRLVYPVKVRLTGDPAFDLKPGLPADVILGGSAEPNVGEPTVIR